MALYKVKGRGKQKHCFFIHIKEVSIFMALKKGENNKRLFFGGDADLQSFIVL